MKNIALTLIGAAVLTACGGGGGGDGVTQSKLSFQLQSAYKALVTHGFSKTLTISGSCGGSGTYTVAPATTAATFEGTAGFSASQTASLSFTGCAPASSATTATAYFDSNYAPLGSVVQGGSYGVYTTPLTIPATVSVGDTGTLGTLTKYTDSTKTKLTCGSTILSYAIESDTADTAIVNLIQKDYELTSGVVHFSTTPCSSESISLASTSQARYRIDANGILTPVSIDTQYANGSTTHLVFTFN
jgi:hypothetical protein